VVTRTFLLVIVACLAASCTFIVFDQPMPPDGTPLDRVPASLQGLYTYELEKMTSSEVEIGENYFIRDSVPEYLSDSLILKPYGKKYVLSKKISDLNNEANGKWFCYILSPETGSGLEVNVFCIADTTYEEKLIVKYNGKYLNATKEFGDSFLYLNADLKMFKKLSKDKKVTIPVMLTPVK